MKTEMVFETSVSTKGEPHYPAENPKELLHVSVTVPKSSAQKTFALNSESTWLESWRELGVLTDFTPFQVKQRKYFQQVTVTSISIPLHLMQHY
jgi:hypothetical protein